MNWPFLMVYLGARAGAGYCLGYAGFALCKGDVFWVMMSGLSAGIFWLLWQWYEEK